MNKAKLSDMLSLVDDFSPPDELDGGEEAKSIEIRVVVVRRANAAKTSVSAHENYRMVGWLAKLRPFSKMKINVMQK